MAVPEAASAAVVRISAVISLLLPFAFAFAVDFNYPAIFNFGDSNSDTGNLVAGLGHILNPPNGQTYFLKPAGRLSDGRLIIDFLMDAMAKPFLNAYLDSVGAPSFQKGCNFAASGSTVLPATAFSFGIQVAQFFRFKNRVLELLAEGSKLKNYIPQVDFFSKGLYMFDIGQNDLTGAFFFKSENQVIAFIPTILLEFETGLKKLYEQGARRFWIHNTGPLGCLPQIIASFGEDPSKLDELGCVSSHNNAAKHFNLQLHTLCTKLQGEFGDANITYIDIFSIKYDLIANYSEYGFEQPITACYDSRIGCDDPTKYVNWDGVHYTEAANCHVSSQILTGKYYNPPSSDKIPFLLKLRF